MVQSDGSLRGGNTLSSSACAATALASLAAAEICEGAKVSGHVASHTNALTGVQGKMKHLSGCFPPALYSPVDSYREGTLAEVNAL